MARRISMVARRWRDSVAAKISGARKRHGGMAAEKQQAASRKKASYQAWRKRGMAISSGNQADKQRWRASEKSGGNMAAKAAKAQAAAEKQQRQRRMA